MDDMLSRWKILWGRGAAATAGGPLVASSFFGMGSAKSYADAIASQRMPLTPDEGLRGAIRTRRSRQPDLVMRFGFGPDLPKSARRPVEAVMDVALT